MSSSNLYKLPIKCVKRFARCFRTAICLTVNVPLVCKQYSGYHIYRILVLVILYVVDIG